jgi:hypothetical protein
MIAPWCRRTAALAVRLAIALTAGVPGVLPGQSVSPPVVEYRRAARGKFEITNTTLFPLVVVLEPRCFRVNSDGVLFDEPLDTANIHLKLSAMSFRIPPRQSYTVYYEATATRLPAWFHVISAITGPRTTEGVNVRVELPHVVYLLQSAALRRADVSVVGFSYDSLTRKATVEVQNNGPALGRVLESELRGTDRGRAALGAFPLFPGFRRRVEVPWPANDEPERLLLRFAGFAMETRLTPTPG